MFMEYQEFGLGRKFGANQIVIPVFVPRVLLKHDLAIRSYLAEKDIEMPAPGVSYNFTMYAEGVFEDRLDLKSEREERGLRLTLATKVENNNDQDGRIEVEEKTRDYRNFAGEDFEPELFQPYEVPPSRISPQKGIYFSPQDNVITRLSFTRDNPEKGLGNFCVVDFTNRTDFYWVPRGFLSFPERVSDNPEVEFVREYFLDNKDKIPERNPFSMKNTKEGLELMKLIADCYVEALKVFV